MAVVSAAKSDLKIEKRRLAEVTLAESTPYVVTVFMPEETPAKKAAIIRKIAALQFTDFRRRMSAAGGRRNKKKRSVPIGSDDRLHASYTLMFICGDRVSAGPGFLNPAKSGRNHDKEWRHV
uniref:Uncharacterized protein n=1 Tax=Peronospora matthiolae TaxID=2874970 RepID=A0AAV1TID3_9STRA